jgi:hypothetical protein
VKHVTAVALFLATVIVYAAADLGADDLGASLLFLAIGLVFGLAVGEWWAVLLAALWLVAAMLFPDPDSGVGGTLWLVGLVFVPVSGVAVALGVGARRLFSRGSARIPTHGR